MIPGRLRLLAVLVVAVVATAGYSLLTSADSLPSPTPSPVPAATIDFSPAGSAAAQPSVNEPPQPPGIDAATALLQARRQAVDGDPGAAASAYQALIERLGPQPELLFQLGVAQMAAGSSAGALASFRRVLDANPPEPVLGRARMMEALSAAAGGDAGPLRAIPVEQAPDGLGDLLALRRAEAAIQLDEPENAVEELSRRAMRESTNRVILNEAARLAEQLAADGLAGELYARGARYPAWTAQKSAMMESAALAFTRAGEREMAVAQYRSLIESYGWTGAAQRAGRQLDALGGLTPYHAGLLAINDGRFGDARSALAEAASGEYASRAAAALRNLDEAEAWREAAYDETVEGYRAFRDSYPSSARAPEAQFQEGFVLYRSGELDSAREIWEAAAADASGDNLSRLHLWIAKVLEAQGDGEGSAAQLEQAAGVHPAGYYAFRARDLLAGERGWPETAGAIAGITDEERGEAERWIAEWVGGSAFASASTGEQVRRGFGLLALGLREEAAAEMAGLIANSDDPIFLFQLAMQLVDEELWPAVYRAGTRLVTTVSTEDRHGGARRSAAPGVPTCLPGTGSSAGGTPWSGPAALPVADLPGEQVRSLRHLARRGPRPHSGDSRHRPGDSQSGRPRGV